jgi:hypothetical protein
MSEEKKWAEQHVALKARKDDIGKLRFDLILPEFLEELAKVLTEGAEKYEVESWKKVPGARARYIAAMHRHLNAFQKGWSTDSETKQFTHHMAHVAANAMFLMWFDNNRDIKI